MGDITNDDLIKKLVKEKECLESYYEEKLKENEIYREKYYEASEDLKNFRHISDVIQSIKDFDYLKGLFELKDFLTKLMEFNPRENIKDVSEIAMKIKEILKEIEEIKSKKIEFSYMKAERR